MYRLIAICFLAISTNVSANQTERDFNRFKSDTGSLKSMALNSVKNFNPGEVFKNYNQSPATQNYYQGSKDETLNLSADANRALKDDIGGQAVVNNFGKTQFQINKNNNAIQHARLIEEESHAIVHGESTSNIDCEKAQQNCEYQTVSKTCYTSRNLPEQTCSKRRHIEVTRDKTSKKIVVRGSSFLKFNTRITVNIFSGEVKSSGIARIDGPIQVSHGCGHINATVIKNKATGTYGNKIKIEALPTCANNGELILNYSDRYARLHSFVVVLDVEVLSEPYIVNESWVNDCFNLENQPSLCHLKDEVCLSQNETRTVNGLVLTRDCWEKSATFACRSAKVDECSSLKNSNCLQISSRCQKPNDTACDVYEQTYSCQKKVCSLPTQCLKNLFCADGECQTANPTQNQNFGESLSSLAAVSGAANEFKDGKPSMFSGKVATCKIWVTDLIDCCSDKGWGKKLNLTHCRDEDRDLGQAKLNYKAHYLGKYCSKKELGICLEHKNAYCVFDTKLARIIQEDGRLRQIDGNALGTAEMPTCGGLTPEELQRIDMSRVDFVSPEYPFNSGQRDKKAGIAGDISINPPNSSDLLSKAGDKIQAHMEDLL